MPDLAGAVGRVLLAAGAALIVLSLLLLLPRVMGVRRRAVAVQRAALDGRDLVLAGLTLLRAERAETEALLVPWRRLLRWARHPLVVATFEWHRRRRRSRRQRR